MFLVYFATSVKQCGAKGCDLEISISGKSAYSELSNSVKILKLSSKKHLLCVCQVGYPCSLEN